MMHILKTIHAVKSYLSQKRDKGHIGFVPTMGSLHAGHGALITYAQQECHNIIVSIFVNLKQFSIGEDFERYPRNLEQDLDFLTDKQVDAVFLPEISEIYPEYFSTTITVSGPAEGLESLTRPHFFSGVATIVTKLFMICAPDRAYFGEKDYQQYCVIRSLVRDLCLPIEIIGVPTERAPDGTALSSRNLYLSPEERKIAPILYKELSNIAHMVTDYKDLGAACAKACDALQMAGFSQIDYLEARAAHNLDKDLTHAEEIRILGAAWLGQTRLIDNVLLDGKT